MRIALAILVLSWLLAATTPLSGHSADQGVLVHHLWLELDRTGLRVQDTIICGERLVRRLWSDLDADGDGRLSPTEQDRWARHVAAGFRLTVDGRVRPLRLADYEFPDEKAFFGSEHPSIRIRMGAPETGFRPGGHSFVIENQALTDYPGLFPRPSLIVTGYQSTRPVARDGGRRIEIDLLGTGSRRDTATGGHGPPLALGPEISGNGPLVRLPRGGVLYARPEPPGPTSELDRFRDWVRQPLALAMMALGISAALLAGAVQGLHSGHGAASPGAGCPAGSRLTMRDAAWKGASIALARTGWMFPLGAAGLWLARLAGGTAAGRGLGLASATVVAGLGICLLGRGLRGYYQGDGTPCSSADGSEAEEREGARHVGAGPTVPEAGTSGREPAAAPGGKVSGGGLIPGWDALAILAAAVSAGQVAFGLAAVLTYSVAIGVAVTVAVRRGAGGGRGARLGESSIARVLSAVSGGLIALLGMGLLVAALGELGWLRISVQAGG